RGTLAWTQVLHTGALAIGDLDEAAGPADAGKLCVLHARFARTYIPEKKQAGQRHRETKLRSNRRRTRIERACVGNSLLRRRGDLVERSFAHCYETGGMRRTHLRGPTA